MTPEPQTAAPNRAEPQVFGHYAKWLAAIKANLEATLAERHQAEQEKGVSHHEGHLWLAEGAYKKACRAMVGKVEGLTPHIAEQTLMPGIIDALNGMLQPHGLVFFHPRVIEKSYAVVREESANTVRLIPGFIVPKSTSICRALAYTIARRPSRK